MLLLYHRPIAWRFRNAGTVWEHIRAFSRHSRFPVWPLNTAEGFRPAVAALEFDAVVLHYSVFGIGDYQLGPEWEAWLATTTAYKLAFFQDEHVNVGKRHSFLERERIDCVFTCVEPPDFDGTYGQAPFVPRLVSNLPGYASPEMVEAASRYALHRHQRPIDVGYRGRPLAPYMGRGSQEKSEIALRFSAAARHRGLRLDIDTSEAGRLYGEAWPRFMGQCKAMLGVESGVSVFDVDDVVHREYVRRVTLDPDLTIDDLADVLAPYEDRVHYRTISPRHFEAAAFRVLQVLYEGEYSGLMRPMEHYVPLRKDFSNLDDVLDALKDEGLAQTLTENAYRELVASGDHTYATLIERFDGVLLETGLDPAPSPAAARAVARAIRRGPWQRSTTRAQAEARHLIDEIYLKTPQPIVDVLARVRYAIRPKPTDDDPSLAVLGARDDS